LFIEGRRPGHGLCTDVWARRNGQWLAVSAHVTDVSVSPAGWALLYQTNGVSREGEFGLRRKLVCRADYSRLDFGVAAGLKLRVAQRRK
jgi:hypothetical protein